MSYQDEGCPKNSNIAAFDYTLLPLSAHRLRGLGLKLSGQRLGWGEACALIDSSVLIYTDRPAL